MWSFRFGYDGGGFDTGSALQAIDACREFADEQLKFLEFVDLANQYHPKPVVTRHLGDAAISHSNFRKIAHEVSLRVPYLESSSGLRYAITAGRVVVPEVARGIFNTFWHTFTQLSYPLRRFARAPRGLSME